MLALTRSKMPNQGSFFDRTEGFPSSSNPNPRMEDEIDDLGAEPLEGSGFEDEDPEP
jgi:hypothetical protein